MIIKSFIVDYHHRHYVLGWYLYKNIYPCVFRGRLDHITKYTWDHLINVVHSAFKEIT